MQLCKKQNLLKCLAADGKLVPYPLKEEHIVIDSDVDLAGPLPVPGDSLLPKNYMQDADMVKGVLDAQVRLCTNDEDPKTVPILAYRAVVDPHNNTLCITIETENPTAKTARITCVSALPKESKLIEDSTRFQAEGFEYARKVYTNKKAKHVFDACSKSEDHAAVLTQGGHDFVRQECSQVPRLTKVIFAVTLKLNKPCWQPCVAKRSGMFQDYAVEMPTLCFLSCGGHSTPEVSVHILTPKNGVIELPDEQVARQGLADSKAQHKMRIWLPALEDGSAKVTLPRGPCGNAVVLCRVVKWKVEDPDWDVLEKLDVSLMSLNDARLSASSIVALPLDKESVHVLDVNVPFTVPDMPAANIDLFLFLDVSMSTEMKMKGNLLNNRDMAKAAVNKLVNYLINTIYPELSKNGSLGNTMLTIACFHSKTTVLGSADLNDKEKVLDLLKKCTEYKMTGGTSFTSWLDVLRKKLSSSRRPLVVLLSDGGDPNRAHCLNLVHEIKERSAAEFVTFGFGAFLDERLMNDLATYDCQLFPSVDSKYVFNLCRSVVAALLYVARQVHLRVCKPHMLLSAQGQGKATPLVESKMFDEVEDVVAARPGSKLRLFVHGPKDAPVRICINKADWTTVEGPNDGLATSPVEAVLTVLGGIDPMHQQEDTAFAEGAELSPIIQSIGLKYQLVTSETKATTKITPPPGIQMGEIFKAAESDEVLMLLGETRIAAKLALSFDPSIAMKMGCGVFHSPSGLCEGDNDDDALAYNGVFRSLGGLCEDDNDADKPVYRGLGLGGSSGSGRPVAPAKPGVYSWANRTDPWEHVRCNIPGALRAIMETFPRNTSGKRKSPPRIEDEEADELVKMAIAQDIADPSPYAKDLVDHKRLSMALFLNRIKLEYDLDVADVDADAELGAVAELVLKLIVVS